MAMFDYRCSKCGTKNGFSAPKATDAPPCRKCGHKIDPKVLEHDEKLMAQARAELLKMKD